MSDSWSLFLTTEVTRQDFWRRRGVSFNATFPWPPRIRTCGVDIFFFFCSSAVLKSGILFDRYDMDFSRGLRKDLKNG